MRGRGRDVFTTVRVEGQILPPDLLARVSENDADLGGLRREDYHLSGETINEAVSRSWNRLLGAWKAFKERRENLLETEPETAMTRERWLLPLFRELDYGRLQTSRAVEIEGKSYPVSHAWEKTPIHLAGYRADLDRRTVGRAGAARMSPHSLVQELLNRSEAHLWAFVSNGLRLRVLRDNASLTRQAYVEFDLEAMMEGEVYPDFVLLWMLCHQSRVEVSEGERPEECRLEKWSQAAAEQGSRASTDCATGWKRLYGRSAPGFFPTATTPNSGAGSRVANSTSRTTTASYSGSSTGCSSSSSPKIVNSSSTRTRTRRRGIVTPASTRRASSATTPRSESGAATPTCTASSPSSFGCSGRTADARRSGCPRSAGSSLTKGPRRTS